MARICSSYATSSPILRSQSHKAITRCLQPGLSLVERLQARVQIQKARLLLPLGFGQQVSQQLLHESEFVGGDQLHALKIAAFPKGRERRVPGQLDQVGREITPYL